MKINDRRYEQEDLLHEIHSWGGRSGWEADNWHFIGEWLDDGLTVELRTSGSTGAPKMIEMSKEGMRRSAALTITHLDLSSSDHFLLCIPSRYVGGKMMMIRAMESGADLSWTSPSSLPQLPAQHSSVDLTAMVPLQIERLLDERPENLPRFGKIIIGGAPLSPDLENRLRPLGLPLWQTFGMTETASHIALRRISGPEATDIFSAVQGVTVSTEKENRLVIHAPHIREEPIETTDLVELMDDRHFRWLGRADNVINSGGIKIIPEEIERRLAERIKSPFFIMGIADGLLGQRSVLCIEGDVGMDLVQEACGLIEEKHKRPKEAWFFDEFVRTGTGKVKRKETMAEVGEKVSI